MSNFSRRFKLSALSAAVLAVNGMAYAQENTESIQEEELVVTGIRGSIRGSINDKRDASQVVDSIVAEDIGKSTDKNIAEALNRVSGVSITEQGGEGAFISIRGASPEQTVITMNGNALGTTEFGSQVNLSSFSADILSKIEVIKTPSADNEEGALGGLVNLVTRKPLELRENVRSVGIEGRWNSQYNEDKTPNNPIQDYRLSGSFSHTFLDDTLGFLVTVVDEKNPTRQDFVQGRDWDSARSYNAQTEDGTEYRADGYDSPSLWGIAARQTAYGVRQGQRDRQALDFAGQWQPTEATSVTLNINYALQQVENTMDEVTIRNNDQSRMPNFNLGSDGVGTLYPTDNGYLNEIGATTPWQDPSNWMILDPDTRTWTHTQRRFDSGDVNASSDIFENENTTASLEIEQSLFDDKLQLTFGASHTKAEQTPDQRINLNLQTARENPAPIRFYIHPAQLEAQGVDCSSGECTPLTGESFVSYGSVITEPTSEEVAFLEAAGIRGTYGQVITARGGDNVAFTGQNPDDLLAKSIGVLRQTLTTVEDTNDVAYFDADFEFEHFGLTSLEFGAKYTKREKLVDDQNGIVSNTNPAASITDPVTGLPVMVGNALDQIPLQPFRQEVAPNGFLSGLGLGNNAVSDGFSSVDPVEVFELVRLEDGIGIDIDDSETRTASFDNIAAYLKANFAFLDDRLTGNVGVRYVETEVATTGSSGVSAFNESFGRNQRIHDLRILRSLMNPSDPACPAIPANGGEVAFGDEARYARVDGLGVDTLGTSNFNDDVALPASLPCHEPFLLDVANLQDNGGFPADLRRYNNVFWTNNDIFTGGFETVDGLGEQLVTGNNNTIRTFDVTGAHKYNVLLPSLNLSYLLNDDMILRFAASKTMTRPPIDSLRPGFSISEAGWGNPATRRSSIDLFNTNLDPLTSKNLDVSYEWYFAEDALLGVGLFYKDIANLVESEEQTVYLRDVKTEVQNGEDVTSSGLILDENSITMDNCFATILGEWQYGYNPAYVEEMLFGDDPSFLCASFNAEQPRNAKGSSITGLELQYTQSYTMLPGIFGGLGLSANYTYQDSAYDDDTSDLIEGLELAPFMIERTPEHSYNFTGFWQSDEGHQLRLAYSGTTDMLIQRNFENGTRWAEGRGALDFSAAYQVNDSVSVTLDVTNILDDPFRHYFTSTSIQLPEDALAGGTVLVDYNEDNAAIDGNAYKGRTIDSFTTGQTYRLGVRVNF